MGDRQVLFEQEITERLEELPGRHRSDDEIIRSYGIVTTAASR